MVAIYSLLMNRISSKPMRHRWSVTKIRFSFFQDCPRDLQSCFIVLSEVLLIWQVRTIVLVEIATKRFLVYDQMQCIYAVQRRMYEFQLDIFHASFYLLLLAGVYRLYGGTMTQVWNEKAANESYNAIEDVRNCTPFIDQEECLASALI